MAEKRVKVTFSAEEVRRIIVDVPFDGTESDLDTSEEGDEASFSSSSSEAETDDFVPQSRTPVSRTRGAHSSRRGSRKRDQGRRTSTALCNCHYNLF